MSMYFRKNGRNRKKDIRKLLGRNTLSHLSLCADGIILAKNTTERTACKKNRSRPARTAQTGLLPVMKSRPGHHGVRAHPAKAAALFRRAKRSAAARAQLARLNFHFAPPSAQPQGKQPNRRAHRLSRGATRAACHCIWCKAAQC